MWEGYGDVPVSIVVSVGIWSGDAREEQCISHTFHLSAILYFRDFFDNMIKG